MRLFNYRTQTQTQAGVIDSAGNARSLAGITDAIAPSILADMSALRATDVESLPLIEGAIDFAPSVIGCRKFICIGLNYFGHAKEVGAEPPQEPIMFMKATSAICGPNDPIQIPRDSVATDWEVELGVVIGKPAKHVREQDALDHVAGYTVSHDISERDFQLRRGGQWSKGKSCDTFGPLGPYLVTADEVADPQKLAVWLNVNGVSRQVGNTADMIFSVAAIIAYLSDFMTLEPGDVISTGTPEGVGMGMSPPCYLQDGDVVELGIDGLGQQRQLCEAYKPT